MFILILGNFLYGQTITYPGATASFCPGSGVVLTPNPTGSVYQWQLNGTNVSTAATYTVRTAGTVTVTVDGNLYPALVIIAGTNPIPSFNTTNDNTCSGTPIQFSTTSVTGGIAPYTYLWNFGDGHISTLQNPLDTLRSIGCGTASLSNKLTVTDANGCTGSISNNIRVLQKPDVQLADTNTFSPFSNCAKSPTPASPNYKLKVDNISPSKSCIVSYSLDWDDGTIENGLTAASFPRSHIYTKLGIFNVSITGVGNNGCSNTQTYEVVNQSVPASGISGPIEGGTSGCAPIGFWFKIKNYQTNSPGTYYDWDFGDNSTKVHWDPLLVDSIFHIFDSSSCSQPGNQFIVKVVATNGCKPTPATIGSIFIYTKPKADFNIPVSACINQTVTFTNTSTQAYNEGSCSRTTVYNWDFGDAASSQNTSSVTSPTHIYTSSGTYTVTLTATGSCGSDVIKKNICITIPPVPKFTLSDTSICITTNSVVVYSTNTSDVSTCPPTKFKWTVTFKASACGTSSFPSPYIQNSTDTSLNPIFLFTNVGAYTINLAVTSPSCGSATFSKTINVKRPPSVSLPSKYNDVCDSVTICPIATVINCGTGVLKYTWLFDGGALGTSTLPTPPCVTFKSIGTHTISLNVANECGDTTLTRTFTISGKQDLIIPSSASFCPADSAGPFVFTTNTPGSIISWKNSNTSIGLGASGTGNIPRFKVLNSSAAPITGIITVTVSSSSCPTPSSFNITINPNPKTPPVPTSFTFCKGAAPSSLKDTSDAGNYLLWYKTAVGGLGDTTTPIINPSVIGQTTYYVSQKNRATDCESTRIPIVVNVNDSPIISDTTSINPTVCNTPNGTIILKGLTPNTSYQVQYTFNSTFISKTQNTDGAGYIVLTGLSTGQYYNIGVKLGSCASNVIPSITLSAPSLPSSPTITVSKNPLCIGDTLILKANSTLTNGIYNWTGPNLTSTSQIVIINKVTGAVSGVYRASVTVNGCASPTDSVNVAVNQNNPTPTDSSNSPLCITDTLRLSASTNSIGSIFYSWVGPNGFKSSSQNPIVYPIDSTFSGNYLLTITSSQNGCPSAPATTVVKVLPNPKVTIAKGTNPTGCASSNGTISLYGLTPSTLYVVYYSKNHAINLSVSDTSNAAGIFMIKGLSDGIYSDISIGQNKCSINIPDTFKLQGPLPFKAMISSNKPSLCDGDSLTLTASPFSLAAVYTWTTPNGTTSNSQKLIINPASIANAGIYFVSITISGCTDTTSIPITVASKPVGGYATPDTTICTGINTGTIHLKGNIGSVTRWESTINNGGTWNRIANSSTNLIFTNLTTTTWYRANIQNGSCTAVYSDTAIVSVANAVTNVKINPQSIITCSHDTTIIFGASYFYNSTDSVSYNWFINNTLVGNANFLSYHFKTATNTVPVQYTINALIENTIGCGDTSIPVIVTIQPTPIASINVSPSVVQYQPKYTFTFADASTAKVNETYLWDVGDRITRTRSGHDITYTYSDIGTYKVTLLVDDVITNCTATDSTKITILPVVGSLYVPNAFYPNSAINELRTFKPIGIGMETYDLQIFDKWGKLVFKTQELNPDGSAKTSWDGTDLNNNPLPQGVYLWKIVAKFKNGTDWNGMSYNDRSPSTYNTITLFR